MDAPSKCPSRANLALRARYRLGEPTDVAGLVMFRVLFGLLVATIALRALALGWVERALLRPTFFFKFWGFAWVEPWPAWGMHLHLALLALAGLFVAAGLCYRAAIWALFAGFCYLELLDVTGYLNHYYLVLLLGLVLGFMPLGRAGSVDAWRAPATRIERFPAWCTWVLRFQIGLVYFFAALAKLSPDWLVFGQPLGIWLAARSELPLVGSLLAVSWGPLAMSWAGFLYDLTIPLWLSWRRVRPYAYGVVLAFHLTVGALFNIGLFPFIMTGAALVFFSPSWPRVAAAWLRRAMPSVAAHAQRLIVSRRDRAMKAGKIAANAPLGHSGIAPLGHTGIAPLGPIAASAPLGPIAASAPLGHSGHAPLGRIGFAVLVAYCAAQALVPLRHWLYPGSVLWHEQGMRWSWRVLAREKNGAVTFVVTYADGQRRIVTPRKYLTDRQEREMSGQPDLILQLAHHVARDFDARGVGPVEVRADAIVSLNGRPAARLIDASVDLAKIDDGLERASFILPAPDTLPLGAQRARRDEARLASRGDVP